MALSEITTLTALWRSPEWKARSRAYVKDKACEWCGARAGGERGERDWAAQDDP